ncbi:DUF58 domain-containing protein [Chloroflexota bacterium]
MKRISINLLCRAYLLFLLATVTILSSLPYSVLALILSIVLLFISFRPLKPRLSIAIILAFIFLLPLLLEPFVYYLTNATLLLPTLLQLMAVTAILPAVYLLDYSLRQNAQDLTLVYGIKGRHITAVLNTLFVSVLAILLVSLILNNHVMLFTGIAFFLYLISILIWVLRVIPKLPLDIPAIWKNIIAGNTANIALLTISKAPTRLYCLINPINSWIKITPQRFTLNSAKIELDLTITPPLAGPTYPKFQLSIVDPWGFIQVNHVIEPVELHVIPRARYAEWLAIKFLEHPRGDVAGVSTTSFMSSKLSKGGTEYFDSRTYQPGDEPTAIDWKHTMKSKQLIVKEYTESNAQATIIGVNLSVADAEEADKLAFDLITTALTLAYEAIPTGLAGYNHEGVVVTNTVTNPREILKQVLLLVKDITSVEFAHRFLQPPNLSKLRRNITLLKQVTSKASQQLLSMLDFEYQAIEEATKRHPATLAISSVTKYLSPPAIIALISQLNHDAEALPRISEHLSKKGFNIVPITAVESTLRSITMV